MEILTWIHLKREDNSKKQWERNLSTHMNMIDSSLQCWAKTTTSTFWMIHTLWGIYFSKHMDSTLPHMDLRSWWFWLALTSSGSNRVLTMLLKLLIKMGALCLNLSWSNVLLIKLKFKDSRLRNFPIIVGWKLFLGTSDFNFLFASKNS